MKKLLLLPVIALVACPSNANADNERMALECTKSATFLAPPDSPGRRQYAPDREVQVMHLALDVTPDFKKRTVQGKATIRFKPIAKPLQELRLDAVDLKISSVTCSEKLQGYQAVNECSIRCSEAVK